MELSWLGDLPGRWLEAARNDRGAHAVLLTGPPGVGKRATAVWMAQQRLSIAGRALPVYPAGIPEHPDLRWIRPAEGKGAIGIDQIRELVADLALTSYEGGSKVAVIEPANVMTAEAANSLLKTLEEPPGDALLILLADRLGRLPATILSRCQRLTIAVPAEAVSLDWLERRQPDANWRAALLVAGGAPLEAIEARETLGSSEALERDLIRVAERRSSPVEVAARWAAQEPQQILTWLSRQVQNGIRRASGISTDSHETSTPDVAECVLSRMDRRNLFCYLDTINRLRGQPAGSYNLQLALESLLIDLSGGLRDCGKRFIRGGVLPIPDGRMNAQ